MNTYLIEYRHGPHGVDSGSASLVANNDMHAAEVFHRCYEGEPRMIVRMTRVFVDGKRVDEDVICYPVELGGGPVDTTPDPVVTCDCGRTITAADGMCVCGLHVSDLDYGPRVWGLHI